MLKFSHQMYFYVFLCAFYACLLECERRMLKCPDDSLLRIHTETQVRKWEEFLSYTKIPICHYESDTSAIDCPNESESKRKKIPNGTKRSWKKPSRFYSFVFRLFRGQLVSRTKVTKIKSKERSRTHSQTHKPHSHTHTIPFYTLFFFFFVTVVVVPFCT